MKLNKVTITGADDEVNPLDLVELQKEFPFVEWGILFSESKAGTPRYPSKEWIEKIKNRTGICLSAHLCGAYSKKVIEYTDMSFIQTLLGTFDRVQLNYSFKDASYAANLLDVVYFAIDHPDINIILQHNKTSAYAVGTLMQASPPSNIHVLYDASGGRGKFDPGFLNNPTFKNYTGYAGGIGVLNVDWVCKKINDSPGDQEVWIDMESGVRDQENNFSVDLVREVLRQCQPYVNIQ